MRLIRSGGRASSGGGTFVRSIKQECLRHIIPLGERHLRTTVHEFVEHYHSERNHQSTVRSERIRGRSSSLVPTRILSDRAAEELRRREVATTTCQ
jgi:hypothetical protein